MITRVWFENDAIQMDGLEAQPARSLVTALDGDRVHILTLSGLRLAQLVYTEYGRKDGSGFASAAVAKAYLDGEFGRAPVVVPATWLSITGKPAVFPPSAHTHAIGDVTGLQAALDGKQPAGVGVSTLLGTVTIGETALVAIAAGVRKVTVAVPAAFGVVTGGNYLLFPVSATPAGYALADVVATAANTLQVTLTVPLIALGASYSIPCRLVRINT